MSDTTHETPLEESRETSSPQYPIALPVPSPPPRRSTPPVAAPSASKLRTPIVLFVAAFASVGTLLAVGIGLARAHSTRSSAPERAIVRISSGDSTGTGFFVRSPNARETLAVTALHVIENGGSITVQRVARYGDNKTYVQAYPEVEVAAIDRDADLALLRIKDLPEDEVSALVLATEVTRDEPITSFGFPASQISRLGLVKKEGKTLDIVKLPVIDRAYNRIVREGAVDGVILSTDLEPGFSGGPTLNQKGKVVGVNVLKDQKYRGQNGAVSVTVLSKLFASFKPFAPPQAQELEAILKNVQDQHLMLSVDDRSKAFAILARSDLPHVHAMLRELRVLEQDSLERDFGPNAKITGRALLGILLARLPGRSLETFYASSTQDAVRKCEGTTRGIRRFLGELENVDANRDETDCARLAQRPLAWDLAAVTLEWSGTPRDYAVTQIDEIDSEAKIFRASVRMSGIPSLVPIHFVWEAGQFRIKLFDKTGRLFALDGPRNAVGRDFEGTWVAKQPRHANPATPGIESESDQKLIVSISGTDAVSIGEEFRTAKFAAAKGGRFACNHAGSMVSEGKQSLTGKLQNGIVSGTSAQMTFSTNECTSCGLCTAPAKLFVLKLQSGRLLLHETDGKNPVTITEFTRGG